jgi:hypothetical protein
MRLCALAAGTLLALFTPVFGAVLGGTWYLFAPGLAGALATATR